MNFEEFKTNALRTESKPKQIMINLKALALFLKHASHTAALLDQVKKTMFYNKPFDLAKFTQNIADQRDLLDHLVYAAQAGSITENPGVVLEGVVDHVPNLRITHGAIGMFTESGELLDAVLLEMETGALDLVNVAEETGDSDWYKAIIHDESGITEERVREKVIAKLKARYGDKFTDQAAQNRDLAAERKVLEG
jgi:hypothetical protein